MSPNHAPILLVEDNDDDVLLTRRALAKGRIANELVVARDGVEALERLHGPGAPAFGVVLLDLELPRVDGFEVLDRLRHEPRTHHLPVVILTSSKEEEDIVRGYALGTNSYVRKPLDFEAFVDAVRQVGAYWLLLNEAPPAPFSPTSP